MAVRGVESNFVRVELARSLEEFTAAVPTQAARDEARSKLAIDFAFIVGYWSMFAALGALLALRPFSQAA